MFLQYNQFLKFKTHHKVINDCDPITFENLSKVPTDKLILEVFTQGSYRLWMKDSLLKAVEKFKRHPIHNTPLNKQEIIQSCHFHTCLMSTKILLIFEYIVYILNFLYLIGVFIVFYILSSGIMQYLKGSNECIESIYVCLLS